MAVALRNISYLTSSLGISYVMTAALGDKRSNVINQNDKHIALVGLGDCLVPIDPAPTVSLGC